MLSIWFEISSYRNSYWFASKICSNGNLDKTFHLMLFTIHFYAGQYDPVLCESSIEVWQNNTNRQKESGNKKKRQKRRIKCFKCNQPEKFTHILRMKERKRQQPKKWQHKIDFTCKSLFDSNAVDTFHISFSHCEFRFIFFRVLHCVVENGVWHCRTSCMKSDSKETAHTFLTS